MTATLFSNAELALRDPILGLTEAFVADARPRKVNLGVGVYCAEDGKIPLLRAVRAAEQARAAAAAPHGYLPIDGIPDYDAAVQRLLLGAGSALIAAGRVITAQALGGTGALKIGADLLKRLGPKSGVMISNPSWENHRALFEASGFEVSNYPYYDSATNGLNFRGMLDALSSAAPRTIVVLHACCHNPTGVDPTAQQWREIARVVRSRDLVPFLDMAYQGFADGIDTDGSAVRLFSESAGPLFISSSFSKSFSLYGERVGALTILTESRDESVRVLSQLKRVIRSNYSTPPAHGGSVVAAVLNDPALRSMWEEELAQMRERIKRLRAQLVEGLRARDVSRDFGFVLQQRGMFSYTGLSADQVDRLRNDFGIYALSTGRVCVAALNSANMDPVCDAIAAVLKR